MTTDDHWPARKPLHGAGRRLLTTAALALLIALAGCEQPAPPSSAPADVSRPAEILEVSAARLSPGLRFPGRVRAVQRVELAFNVPGQILELPVTEGDAVPVGALLARLDPTSYQTALDLAQAELDAATAEYERVHQLWEKRQAVARAEVDRKRTAMEVARSRFAAAQKDLADTRLTAPFAGVVARRLAETFQNIQAKEPVLSLQNPDALEIVIHVPERVVRGEPRRAAGFAVFDDLPERRLPVTLKSFATEADPQTQTYEVVLSLTPPPDLRVLPGMGVEVLPESASAHVSSSAGVGGGAEVRTEAGARSGVDAGASTSAEVRPALGLRRGDARTGVRDTTRPARGGVLQARRELPTRRGLARDRGEGNMLLGRTGARGRSLREMGLGTLRAAIPRLAQHI